MKQELKLLLWSLEKGWVIENEIINPEVIDKAISERDSNVFESHWMRIHELIEEHGQPDEENSVCLKRIRELAFKRIYRIYQNDEIAGYVSDDFDLIGRALVFNLEDTWLSGLLATYLNNAFPCGNVSVVPERLGELLIQAKRRQGSAFIYRSRS